MRTREPRLWLSLQLALASMAQPCFAGILSAAGVSASSHTDSLGLRIHTERNRCQRRSLEGQEQLCAPRVPHLSSSRVFSLWHVNLQRER